MRSRGIGVHSLSKCEAAQLAALQIKGRATQPHPCEALGKWQQAARGSVMPQHLHHQRVAVVQQGKALHQRGLGQLAGPDWENEVGGKDVCHSRTRQQRAHTGTNATVVRDCSPLQCHRNLQSHAATTQLLTNDTAVQSEVDAGQRLKRGEGARQRSAKNAGHGTIRHTHALNRVPGLTWHRGPPRTLRQTAKHLAPLRCRHKTTTA
jgi:hypothetical protein